MTKKLKPIGIFAGVGAIPNVGLDKTKNYGIYMVQPMGSPNLQK